MTAGAIMKNKRNNELAVCGFAAVKALEQKPGKISRLYFTADKAYSFGTLCRLLAAKRIPYNQAAPEELEKLCGSVHHQGAVAMIRTPELPSVYERDIEAWRASNETVLLLDRIGNANNFGAIVRSAAFFGATNLVISGDENQSYITTSAYRTAQGAMEKVTVFSVPSTAAFLKKVGGIFPRIGTDPRGSQLVHAPDIFPATGCILVLGNEETGISRAVRENCDMLVSVPSPLKTPLVGSLNVAQAASILLYEAAKRRNHV